MSDVHMDAIASQDIETGFPWHDPSGVVPFTHHSHANAKPGTFVKPYKKERHTMRKSLAMICMPLLALSLNACTHDSARDLPPGHYESNTSSVDRYGTGHEQEKSTDVYYDANGDKKAVIRQKNTTDPKGLFNKSTSTSTTVED